MQQVATGQQHDTATTKTQSRSTTATPPYRSHALLGEDAFDGTLHVSGQGGCINSEAVRDVDGARAQDGLEGFGDDARSNGLRRRLAVVFIVHGKPVLRGHLSRGVPGRRLSGGGVVLTLYVRMYDRTLRAFTRGFSHATVHNRK